MTEAQLHKSTTDTEEPVRARVLRTALELTMGDRNKSHGDPVVQHATAAVIFNDMRCANGDALVTAEDMALALVAIKLSRMRHGALNLDDYIDAAAYIAIAAQCRLAAENPAE